MTLLREVMSRHFETLDPETAMTEALRKLESQNLSQLLVCRNERVVGVLEDSDLRRRVLESGCDPAQTPVRRFMSSNVLSGFEEQDVKDLVSPMRTRHVHAIPVLNRESRMVGLFTLGGPWKRSAPERTG